MTRRFHDSNDLPEVVFSRYFNPSQRYKELNVISTQTIEPCSTRRTESLFPVYCSQSGIGFIYALWWYILHWLNQRSRNVTLYSFRIRCARKSTTDQWISDFFRKKRDKEPSRALYPTWVLHLSASCLYATRRRGGGSSEPNICKAFCINIVIRQLSPNCAERLFNRTASAISLSK